MSQSLKIPVHREKKIVLLSDIIYFLNPKTSFYFREDVDTLDENLLQDIIKFLIESYPKYIFWWLDSHEAAITLWDGKGIKEIIKIFETFGVSDKLFFLDNNLGRSKYDRKLNRISGPFLIGFTYEKRFEITQRTFKKKFICLNRSPKTHRRKVFLFLKEKYLDQSYLSFAPEYPRDVDRMVLDRVDERPLVEFNEYSYGNSISAWPIKEQKDSFCNIVTESLWHIGPIHITEKIDKCFSGGQPFVLVSGPYYLKKLKELGFKTFDKWWDESYDETRNYKKRFEKVKETIDYIGGLSIQECEKIYEEMIPTLKHNQELSNKFNNSIYNFWEWNDTDSLNFDLSKKILI